MYVQDLSKGEIILLFGANIKKEMIVNMRTTRGKNT